MNKDPQAFSDWLQTHRELMQLEASFTALAMQAAEGEYPEEQLAKQRAVLEATRAICAAAYQRAFPHAVPQGRKT
jgi:hypothetical protein